jgi:DNA-binding NarL/FixJ family response regulator
MSQIRIVLADDHAIVRAALKALLEQQGDMIVVAEANDGWEALEAIERARPHVAVLDIGMPNLNGIETAKQMQAAKLEAIPFILSMHSDESYVIRALKAGARAFLLKEAADTDLIVAIRAVAAGKSFLSPAIKRLMAEDHMLRLQEKEIEDSFDLLTGREREVLQLAAEGKSNKEIAAALGLSPYTAETHRGNMMQKLNLHTTPEMVLYAVRKGVIF